MRARSYGLRPRLLAALLFTSAVTLLAAALVLLPPLQDRLRRQSVAPGALVAVSTQTVSTQ